MVAQSHRRRRERNQAAGAGRPGFGAALEGYRLNLTVAIHSASVIDASSCGAGTRHGSAARCTALNADGEHPSSTRRNSRRPSRPRACSGACFLQRNLIHTGMTRGEKAGRAHRSAEGAGDGCEEQRDGKPASRAARKIDRFGGKPAPGLRQFSPMLRLVFGRLSRPDQQGNCEAS